MSRSKKHTINEAALTIREVSAAYPSHWILMRVTESDSSGWPIKGHLIAKARSRRAISEAFKSEYANPSLPHLKNAPYYTFKPGQLCASVNEWNQVLNRIQGQPDAKRTE